MNANQIINMIMRVIMRRAVNSGVNAGINAVSGMGKKKQQQAPVVDDFGNETGQAEKPKLTQEQREARRAVRQARRAAKVAQRTTKL